jgi:hypothetical protein
MDSIRRVLGSRSANQDREQFRKLAQAWGLDESALDNAATTQSPDEAGRIQGPSAYDLRMWSKKLQHLVTEEKPIAVDAWRDFMADATALGFDPEWINQQRHDAFSTLLRKAVADGIVTGEEHELIDLWRLRLGLSEAEAEQTLERIVSEASAHLGRDITIV